MHLIDIALCRKSKVLYVEDNEFLRESTLSLLKIYFDKIIVAKDGLEGIEKFTHHDIKIVITDILMPRLNGLEMIKKIRSIDKNVPIIIVSSIDDKNLILDSIKLDIDSFLLRPFSDKDFSKTITKICQKSRFADELSLLYQYQDIVEASTAICKTDLEGNIIYVNNLFCKMCGYKKDEIIGHTHSIIRDENVPQSLYKDLWTTIQSGRKWEGVITNIKKNGEKYVVKTVITPILNNQEEIIEYIAIYDNITEIEKAKNDALAANKAKSEFLANMSHEIRTPLNAIMGFIRELKEIEKDEDKSKYLNIVYQSSQNLLSIINDILDFSKIESGKIEIEYTEFDPKNEFELTYKLFLSKANDKGIKLTRNFKNFPPIVKSDPLRIKQVINNLLSNAIKFTSEGKNIYLNIEFKDDRLYVSVKDEGIGITKEYLKDIFSPFTQQDSSTTRRYGGSGLGLAISYNLIKLLGGELKVESEVEKGSRFYFEIPIELGDVKNINKVKKSHIELNKQKILLVEDNKANQMFMKILLKKLNLEFDIANDGVEAIEMFKKGSYDAVLMDENMPNMNGIKATKKILEYEKENNLKHTPIIALTANALKGDRERFLEAGMDEYLTKPLNKDRLIEVLERVCNAKRV